MASDISFANALMWVVFGLGIHVYVEHCRSMLAECRLFPLPQLRRWKRKHRLLNRPSLLWVVVWIGVFLVAERLVNASWVLLNLLTALSTDRVTSRVFLGWAVVVGV